MKYLALILFLHLSVSVYSQENYTLKVNGKTFDVGLDKEYNLKLNGKPSVVSLKLKEFLTYKHDLFSFQYPKSYSVSQTHIDAGIEQIMIMNAMGAGVIFQIYETIDPTSIKQMLFGEVLKESLSYGYKKETKFTTHVLKTGQKLKTEEATLTYKSDKSVYEIASFSKARDEGIVILTINSLANDPEFDGKLIIDKIWESLKIF